MCLVIATACSGPRGLDCRAFKKGLKHLPALPELNKSGDAIGVSKREYFRGLYDRLVKECSSCEEVRDSLYKVMLQVDPHEFKTRPDGPRYSDYVKQFKHE